MSRKVASTGVGVDISSKNTKEQILAAYQDVLEQLESKAVSDPVTEKRKSQEVEIVAKASQNNADSIVGGLANLKISLIKQIDNLSECLVAEFNKLSDVRNAITIEQKHLQELYGINETAKTLSALILAQQEQKEKFAQEMNETETDFEEEMELKKANWKQQEDATNLEYKELKERLDKARKREDEEYKYNLEQTRRKEADSYTTQKAALENDLAKLRQEWSEREAALKAKEQEFASLKVQVENIPQELAKVKEKTEASVRLQLETHYKYANDLLAKEVDGERKLSVQKISALEQKIKEQEMLINQLTQKADAASQQIQTIACRALDTSAQRFVPTVAYQEEKAVRGSDK